MLKAISALALLAQTLFPTASPGVGRTDAYARALGNAKPLAVRIGRALFTTEWPVQVINVYASGVAGHDIAGLRLSGVHFHSALTRDEFISEITALVSRAFHAAPIEEIDVWVTVPLRVGKDVIVAGDLAKPTSRTVFTVSVRRGETLASLVQRMRAGRGVYWDQEWTRSGLK